MKTYWIGLARGYAGAAAGGALGYLLARWLLRYGYYAPLVPGAMLGLGFGLLSTRHTPLHRTLCGLLGLGLGIVFEATWFPFLEDPSFRYFLLHIHQVMLRDLLFIALGGVCAYWLASGLNRDRTGKADDPASTH